MEKSKIIFKLYPNARVVSEDGVVYDENKQVMTIDENLVNSELETENQAIETAKQADATNKANGNQKLLDLGLTQAEATALTGYTPPVAE